MKIARKSKVLACLPLDERLEAIDMLPADELGVVVSTKAPKNAQNAELHRMGVELKMQEIQQRVESAEKSFRQRCFVLPDDRRLALEEELRIKLR